MNLSAVSSIKFAGDNLQTTEVKPQQAQNQVQAQPEEKSSKFAQLKQQVKDTYSKSTPENTNNLFLASGFMGIASAALGFIGKNHKVIKAVSAAGAIGAVASFALATSHVLADRVKPKQPEQTAITPEKTEQPSEEASQKIQTAAISAEEDDSKQAGNNIVDEKTLPSEEKVAEEPSEQPVIQQTASANTDIKNNFSDFGK